MSKKLKGEDGKYLTLHDHAVVGVERYRGWLIRKFLSGGSALGITFKATKMFPGGVEVETHPVVPTVREVKRQIRVFEDNYRRQADLQNRTRNQTVRVA